MGNRIKYIVAASSVAVFMAAAYYLPSETFLAFFAAGLFLIPASLFIYILQSDAKD
jgi:hypothetical protein